MVKGCFAVAVLYASVLNEKISQSLYPLVRFEIFKVFCAVTCLGGTKCLLFTTAQIFGTPF